MTEMIDCRSLTDISQKWHIWFKNGTIRNMLVEYKLVNNVKNLRKKLCRMLQDKLVHGLNVFRIFHMLIYVLNQLLDFNVFLCHSSIYNSQIFKDFGEKMVRV